MRPEIYLPPAPRLQSIRVLLAFRHGDVQVSISSIILQAAFWCKRVLRCFYSLQFGFVIFWQKNRSAKAVCKMLVIFYEQLFIEFWGAYLCFQFVFVFFWQKDIKTKSLHKIFVQFPQISG
jgi:hypothetical protein